MRLKSNRSERSRKSCWVFILCARNTPELSKILKMGNIPVELNSVIFHSRRSHNTRPGSSFHYYMGLCLVIRPWLRSELQPERIECIKQRLIERLRKEY